MKEIWLAAREDLIQRCIDEGMDEAAAEAYADDRADDAFADYYGNMIDTARQRHKDGLL